MIVQKLQVVEVSAHWLNLMAFVKQHPYVTFERLKFVDGQPDWAEVDLKIKESIKL
jgi:hypothetical protein